MVDSRIMIRIVNVKVNQLVRSMFTMLSVRYIFVRQCWLYFFRCNANGSPFTLICDVLIVVKFQPFCQMQDMYREQLWRKQGRPKELYPDISSKKMPPSLLTFLSLTVIVVSLSTCFNQDIQTQLCITSTHAVVLMW